MSAPSGMAAFQRDCKDHLKHEYEAWQKNNIYLLLYHFLYFNQKYTNFVILMDIGQKQPNLGLFWPFSFESSNRFTIFTTAAPFL